MLSFTKKDFGKVYGWGWEVRNGRTLVGRIVQDAGFLFQPKGHYKQASFWGERFTTLAECQRSLEV